MTHTASRAIYPELPDPLTPGDLQRLFSPSVDERKWASTVTQTPEAQVALLVQLKNFSNCWAFSTRCRFPLVTIEYVARRIDVESELLANPASGVSAPFESFLFHDQWLQKHPEARAKHHRRKSCSHALFRQPMCKCNSGRNGKQAAKCQRQSQLPVNPVRDAVRH